MSTGLLTARCDIYGTERDQILLFGGVFPENMAGRYHWYCTERAEGMFRMVCTGGQYGQRTAPDGGIVPGFTCDGGHYGQEMPLCRRHQRELSAAGYRKPKALRSAAYDGDGHEQHWAPGSVVGGTRANEACPRCAMPPEARELNEAAGFLAGEIGKYIALGLELAAPVVRMRAELAGYSARLDELNLTGRVHKCPLKLIEVS